ncbi:MAG: hypothetical protein FJ333_07445 [Sphingomonadales bacterium]|nr:hypothetical protein [Sphingomonadales bacterium]
MSYAAAANALPGVESVDMEKKGRDSSKWPVEWHSEEFRVGRWIHSDFKNVALPYIHPMFQEMIARGNLNSQ